MGFGTYAHLYVRCFTKTTAGCLTWAVCANVFLSDSYTNAYMHLSAMKKSLKCCGWCDHLMMSSYFIHTVFPGDTLAASLSLQLCLCPCSDLLLKIFSITYRKREIDTAGLRNKKKQLNYLQQDLSCSEETDLSNTSLVMVAFHFAVPVPNTVQCFLTDVNGAICNVVCYICVFTAASWKVWYYCKYLCGVVFSKKLFLRHAWTNHFCLSMCLKGHFQLTQVATS